jgi:hypothetical protein
MDLFMFEQLSAPDHVIAFRLSGKLAAEDIQKYKALFDEKFPKHKHVGVYIDLTGFSDMSADAIIEDAKVEFALFSHLNQIVRCAMISDKEWPQAIAKFVGPLFPDLGLKAFTPDQSDEAMKWGAELPESSEAPLPAFRFLPTSKDDVLAFEINGLISSAEMPGVIEEFESFFKNHEKVRLLNRLKHFGGIDPAVFMQGGLVSMKLAAMQKTERYAIVGAPGWMRKIVESVNPAFADIDIRTFPADREADAWAWLGAEPKK